MCFPNDCCDSRQGSCGYGVCLNGRLAACFPCAVTQPPPCHSITGPLLHVSLSVLGHAHTRSWALWPRELQLCTLKLPTRPATWERAPCLHPAACTALLHFLATKLQPPHQSTLPCTSARLFNTPHCRPTLSFHTDGSSSSLICPVPFPLPHWDASQLLLTPGIKPTVKDWFMWKKGDQKEKYLKTSLRTYSRKVTRASGGKGFLPGNRSNSSLKSCLSWERLSCLSLAKKGVHEPTKYPCKLWRRKIKNPSKYRVEP